MASMYDLTATYSMLIDRYDAAESDEERAAVMEMIEGLQDEIAVKGEQYARIIRNKKGRVEALKAEIKRLTGDVHAEENAIERMEEILLMAMQTADAPKLVTSIGTWRRQLNPWSCKVLDESAVPAEYRIPQPDKIDRAAINKHFRETGEIIPGTDMRREEGLRFR